MRALGSFILFLAATVFATGQGPGILAPPGSHAGAPLFLSTTGSGDGTLYLIGPGHVSKHPIQLGAEIQIKGSETQTAGNYLLLACSGNSCAEAHVFVEAAEPGRLAFLLHPSRIPVSQPNAINAVSVVLDRFRNLVTQPTTVTFQISTKDGAGGSLPLKTRSGIAWTRLASGPKEGAVEITASVGEASEDRVVQQVASDPCNLHAGVQTVNGRLILQTDPVRDCKGNALPDGTIVTFTKVDKGGRSMVDAPIKKSIARAEMPYQGAATISVASGVTLGNEIRVGGGR
jgi:hypothetical protein